MENYRHSPEKFAYFEKLFDMMRERHPGHFRIGSKKSRRYLLAKQYGYDISL